MRSLTLQDSEFVSIVESDIRSFLENLTPKRILIFPPFNNFRRFLIHQTVQTQFDKLKSFSIGEGENRRTVICFSDDYKSITALSSDNCLSGSSITETVQPLNEIPYDSVLEYRKKVKRPRTMPSVSIYRPPAARKLEQNANLSNLHSQEMMGSYSPGKSKFKTSEDLKEISQTGRRNDGDGISVFRNAISSIRTQNKVPKSKNVESANKNVKTESKICRSEEVMKSANQNKQRRPDMQVYVPKGRRTASFNNEAKKLDYPIREEKSCKETEIIVVEKERNNPQVDFFEPKKEVDSKNNKQFLNNAEGKVHCEITESKVTFENIENESSNHIDSRITSYSEDSDKIESSTVNNGHSDSEKVSESEKLKKVKVGHLNPEEDDWEAMYDDTGECLDPSLLDQLTSAVGEVTIEKPKSSYSGYKTKSLDTVADEFPHVIEIYNFPPEFQLQDLMMVFSQFKNSGFEIKWVDDTHALGIFSSSAIVSEVLDFYHPFVKTRSLKDGTILSKMKARRSAEFLLPYKQRPETCSALARRLVTGALGVRLSTSRQEREAEKQILTKAREKKKLEAKQKEDAWEGTFS